MNPRIVYNFIFVLLLSLALVLKIEAQSEPLFSKDDFGLTGDAVSSGERCFQLTRNTYWEGGGVWYREKIDLSSPFEMELNVSFGCNDEQGADGIVFIFLPYLTTGFAGEGMGFGGLYPSFGIEMDTYQNYHLGDPAYDHVAIMQHGSLRHIHALTEYVTMGDGVLNVEDCQYHKVKMKWNPDDQKVLFYFDGSLRIEKKIDLISDIFGGDPNVYWGFTSATGGKTNKHMVCLEKLTFSETFGLSPSDKSVLLDGESYILRKLQFRSGSTKIPKNAEGELEQLYRFFQKHPEHSILIGGYTDATGRADQNQKISRLRAEAVAQYLIDRGIHPDRILFDGYGEENPIAPNDTKEGREKNRRVEVMLKKLRV